jgi:hypothetical protein
MAYLRKEKLLFESDFSLSEIWEKIPKVIGELGWKIESIDEKNQQLKVITIGGLLSYPSSLIVQVWSEKNKVTRIKIDSKTPVTTITALTDFGRIRERIELFFDALSKKLTNKTSKSNTKKSKIKKKKEKDNLS